MAKKPRVETIQCGSPSEGHDRGAGFLSCGGLKVGKHADSELIFEIIGGAMAVPNELEPGLREKTYERALCVELQPEVGVIPRLIPAPTADEHG